MTSNEAGPIIPPTSSVEIADKSEAQHQWNVEQRIRDFGVDTRTRSGLAFVAMEDILSHLEDAAEKQEIDNNYNQEEVIPTLVSTVDFLKTVPGEEAVSIRNNLIAILGKLKPE